MLVRYLSILAAFFSAAHCFAQLSPQQTDACVRRSIVIYTSGKETFAVTDFGSTALNAPTLCLNVSTIIAPVVTTTIVGPAPTMTFTLVNSFENVTAVPFNGSTTSPEVSAAVVDNRNGPLEPYDGSSLLLVTFNHSSSDPTSSILRRQSATTLAYNVTQFFTVTTGTSYTLSIHAQTGPNGALDPECSITICGDNTCGSPSIIKSTYALYSYVFNPKMAEEDAAATFNIVCTNQAYVGLDLIVISSSVQVSPAIASQITVTSTIFQQALASTKLQTITQAQSVIERTTDIPTTVSVYITKTIGPNNITLDASTVKLSPETVTLTLPPQTVYQNLTLIHSFSTADTVPPCSAQSSVFSAGVPFQLDQAASFCSSFLRSTVLLPVTNFNTTIVPFLATIPTIDVTETHVDSFYFTSTAIISTEFATQTKAHPVTATAYTQLISPVSTTNVGGNTTTTTTMYSYTATTYVLESSGNIQRRGPTEEVFVPATTSINVGLHNQLDKRTDAVLSTTLPSTPGPTIASSDSTTTASSSQSPTSSPSLSPSRLSFATPDVWSTYLAEITNACNCVLASATLEPTTLTSIIWSATTTSTPYLATFTSVHVLSIKVTSTADQHATLTITTTVSTPVTVSTKLVASIYYSGISTTSSPIVHTATSVVSAVATSVCARSILYADFETGYAPFSQDGSDPGSNVAGRVANNANDTRGLYYFSSTSTYLTSTPYNPAYMYADGGIFTYLDNLCPGMSYSITFDTICSIAGSAGEDLETVIQMAYLDSSGNAIDGATFTPACSASPGANIWYSNGPFKFSSSLNFARAQISVIWQTSTVPVTLGWDNIAIVAVT